MNKYRIGKNLPLFEAKYRKTASAAWELANRLAQLHHEGMKFS